MAIWTPRLSGRNGPKYQQIVDAIAEDMATGVLPAGTRLPPQRILAYALGISPNTTARAYAEAVRRGLLGGEIGRGTYVLSGPPGPDQLAAGDLVRPEGGPIDFSRNLPAPGPAAAHLGETLLALGRTAGLQSFLDYQSTGDHDHHADAAIDWLGRTGVPARRSEVVITSGAQHGLLASLIATLSPGDLLLTEALSYAPIWTMAAHLGLRTGSVAMDAGGLCPDALEKACQGRKAKALYLLPTLHTPTTVTIDPDRRRAIARIARRHDLLLIEDDVFGRLKSESPPPLAALAPERSLHITSTSKCLSPGLRVGFVRAPEHLVPALREAVSLSCWMPPPLMVEIAARWIFDGTAETLTQAQRAEASARQDLAHTILAEFEFQADPQGFHFWLKLPSGWSPEEFRGEAARLGVTATPGAAFAAEAAARPPAVRLALSHETSRDRVRAGLTRLRDLLRAPRRPRALII